MILIPCCIDTPEIVDCAKSYPFIPRSSLVRVLIPIPFARLASYVSLCTCTWFLFSRKDLRCFSRSRGITLSVVIKMSSIGTGVSFWTCTEMIPATQLGRELVFYSPITDVNDLNTSTFSTVWSLSCPVLTRRESFSDWVCNESGGKQQVRVGCSCLRACVW